MTDQHVMDLDNVDAAVDQIIERVGKTIVLAIPLGLGKPNQLVNAIYRRAVDDDSLTLKIFTALSLEKPCGKSDLESRFLEPFVDRLFGDYEELEYAKAQRQHRLPDNVTVHEFYFKAGAMKKVAEAQRNYISTNYTFVARDMIDNEVNVLAQLVAENDTGKLSLSCNTDVTLDIMPLIDEVREQGRQIVTVAQVHDELPFMGNRAEVERDRFDIVVRNKDYNTRLFAPPNMAVTAQDYAIGMHASSLIADGGTLQIGIGSLGDAIVHNLIMRQNNNADYRKLAAGFGVDESLAQDIGGLDPFQRGLYGSSEMFVNGFSHLIEAGIIKRKVYDDLPLQLAVNELGHEQVGPEMLQQLLCSGAISNKLDEASLSYLQNWGILNDAVSVSGDRLTVAGEEVQNDIEAEETLRTLQAQGFGEKLRHGIFMHGGFYLGPQDFYQRLRDLPAEVADAICMSSVGHINQLNMDYPLLSAQRKKARFVNTAMMMTLSGAAVSDGLESGTVISGVGGQYNFVSMAHDLSDGRSVLCLRASRGGGDEAASNIIHHYGHITIPRHLRDIVITEYGVADLRGKSDRDIIKALLNVSDSRFQGMLLKSAVSSGKIEADYRIPDEHARNSPAKLTQMMKNHAALLPAFPLGTDFNPEEIALGKTLKGIKALASRPTKLAAAVIRSFTHNVDSDEARHFLERMQLDHPNTARETVIQHLLLQELEERGFLKAM